MANWTSRKTTSTWGGARRSTTTSTINKGITTSNSFGDRNYRTTVSSTPGGKTKITTTTRCGNLTKRETRTCNPTMRIKMPKTPKLRMKRGRKSKADAVGTLIGYLIAGLVIFLLIIFK